MKASVSCNIRHIYHAMKKKEKAALALSGIKLDCIVEVEFIGLGLYDISSTQHVFCMSGSCIVDIKSAQKDRRARVF